MKSKNSNVQHLHRPVIFIFLIIILVPSTIIKGQSKPEVTNLRTEYKTNPIGIDIISPRLNWEILSRDRNIMQSAYNIKAALTKENLESEWSKAAFREMGLLSSSDWKAFWIEPDIPENDTAQIHIPAKGIEQVLENNNPVSGDQDIKISGIKNGQVILETGSGEYMFEASND